MTAVICEDEPIYITGLKYSCEAWAKKHPETPLQIRQYNTPEDLLYDWECGLQFEILFLDIEFKKMDGLKLAERIREKDKNMVIVLVTNFRKYALAGYDLHVYRYLIKPALDESVFDCLDYCQQQFFAVQEIITFPLSGGGIKYTVDELIKIESINHKIVLSLREKRKDTLRVYETLESIMERLPRQKFVRINRSVIINLLYVRKYDHAYVELVNGDYPITIGTTYRKTAYQALSNYFWRK